ncbi:MAG: DUF3786 domain-containing protein [Thermodesulfobacteriota bacterium]
MKTGRVFETTYREYLNRLAGIDLRQRAGMLGGKVMGSELVIPFYGKPHRVSAGGVLDAEGKQSNFAICIVLFQYTLMCPDRLPLAGDWMTFRDFKDAGPLTGYFTSNTNRIIETTFGGDIAALERKSRQLGGIVMTDGAAYDFSVQFTALPRIPVLLRFNGRDGDLPAQCTILFQQSAGLFLDMECLAITGTFLAGNLIAPP